MLWVHEDATNAWLSGSYIIWVQYAYLTLRILTTKKLRNLGHEMSVQNYI